MHGDNGGSVRKQYNPDHFQIWVRSLFGAALATLGLMLASQHAGFSLWVALTVGLTLFGLLGLAYAVLFWGREAPSMKPIIWVPSFDLYTSTGWSHRLLNGERVTFDPSTGLVTFEDGVQMNEGALIQYVQTLADILAGEGVYRVEVMR